MWLKTRKNGFGPLDTEALALPLAWLGLHHPYIYNYNNMHTWLGLASYPLPRVVRVAPSVAVS